MLTKMKKNFKKNFQNPSQEKKYSKQVYQIANKYKRLISTINKQIQTTIQMIAKLTTYMLTKRLPQI